MRFLIVTRSFDRAKQIQRILKGYQQQPADDVIHWAKIEKVSWLFDDIICRWECTSRRFEMSNYECVIVDADLRTDLQERVCQTAHRKGVYCVKVTNPEVVDWTTWSGQTGPLHDPLQTNELVVAPLDTSRQLIETIDAGASPGDASHSMFAAEPLVLSFPDHSATGTFGNHSLHVPTTGQLHASEQNQGALGSDERYLVMEFPVSGDIPSDAGHYAVYWKGCRGWLYRIGAFRYQLHLTGVLPPTLTYDELQTVLSTATLVSVNAPLFT